MKNELLKELYDCFYMPPELPTQKQEVEECHQALIETLEKWERRLVLQIIDAKDRIVEDISIDSFISGFELAWQLSMELNNYENARLKSRRHIHRMSGPVCRRVAASRNGRENTRTAPNTRRKHLTDNTFGAGSNNRERNSQGIRARTCHGSNRRGITCACPRNRKAARSGAGTYAAYEGRPRSCPSTAYTTETRVGSQQ